MKKFTIILFCITGTLFAQAPLEPAYMTFILDTTNFSTSSYTGKDPIAAASKVIKDVSTDPNAADVSSRLIAGINASPPDILALTTFSQMGQAYSTLLTYYKNNNIPIPDSVQKVSTTLLTSDNINKATAQLQSLMPYSPGLNNMINDMHAIEEQIQHNIRGDSLGAPKSGQSASLEPTRRPGSAPFEGSKQ